MSLPNSKTQAEKTGSDLGRLEATRKSALIKQMKLDGNVPWMDKSWSAALNRAQNCSRIQQSFVATARGKGRNLARPRDIFKAPGLPKNALLVPKKEEPQDVDSDSDASVLQENVNTTPIRFQTESEVLAGDLNFNLSVQSVQSLQGRELPSSSVNTNGLGTGSTPLVLRSEKEEAQDAEWDSDTGNVNDRTSLSLQIDSVFTVGDFHSVQPRQDNELPVETLNSRLNDEGNGTTPILGSMCHCGFAEKFHQLEKDMKEKNLEVDFLKKQIKNLQQQNALAGAQILEVVINRCNTNDIQQEATGVCDMEESPCLSSSDGSEDEAPSGTTTTGRTAPRISKQPLRAYSLRKGKGPKRTGDPTAINRESIVSGTDSSRSKENSCSGGVEVPRTSSVDPQAPPFPMNSSSSSNSQNSFNEEHASIDDKATHRVDEHLLGKSQFGCICGLRFERMKYLKMHIISQARRKCFNCDQCPKGFAMLSDLNKHLRNCHQVQTTTGFGCWICGQVFKARNPLVQHKIDAHRMLHKTPKPNDVQEHASNDPEATHRVDEHLLGKSQLGCICGLRYQRMENLKKHIISKAWTKRFKCDRCPRVFAMMSDLNLHLRKHHEAQPKAGKGCRICGQVFQTQKLLLQHQKNTHRMLHVKPKINDVPVTHGYCSVVKGTPRGFLCFCGRSYARRQALDYHVRKQRLPAPFKCSLCVAQFSDCCSLKTHVRKCHGQPDYEVHGCYICGATFPNKKLFWFHKDKTNH